MISLILSLILTSSANAQSINASVVRLSPTAVPTVCSTGDLRIDSGDSNALKVCRSNTWYEFAEVLTSFSDPMTTNGDMIYQAAGVPARLGIGTTNYALLSTGSAPSWGLIANANVDASAAIAYSKLALSDSILNADINSAAAIVDTKLATISTAGKVSNSATTATDANTAGAIVARDGSGNFSAGTITAALTGNVTGDLTGNADTATALAANPLDCSSNQFANAIAADGDLTCAQPSFSDVSGTLAISAGGTGQTTAQAAIDALVPSQAGNSGEFLTTNGTTVSWANATGSNLAVDTYTSNQTLTSSNDIVLCDSTSGDVTLTLPASASNTGKVWRIVKTVAANDCIVEGNSTETVGGATNKNLATINEAITVAADGTNVQVLDRRIPSDWVSFTPTGSWSTNTTYTGRYRRIGRNGEFQINVATAGAPTAAGLTVTISSVCTIDTTYLVNTTVNYGELPQSSGSAFDAGNNGYALTVAYSSTTAVAVMRDLSLENGSSGPVITGNSVSNTTPFSFGAGDGVVIGFSVPCTGWED